MKDTKAARISETIENTVENIREEGNDTAAEQKHNERREQAISGLKKKLDELNNWLASRKLINEQTMKTGNKLIRYKNGGVVWLRPRYLTTRSVSIE